MKKCPECGREYDNSMSFCLDDGVELLYGPASTDEPATAIFHETASPVEAQTRAQINTTEAEPQGSFGIPAERQSLSAHRAAEPRSLSAHRAAKPLAASGTVLLILVVGFFGYR